MSSVASLLDNANCKRPCRVFQRFITSFNDDACDKKSARRRSGRRRDESDAPSAERGRKVEPKAVRNKGIFRVQPTKRRCERAPSVDAKQSASRDNRGDARAVQRERSLLADHERSRRRRSTRTAEPRVERRSNRKSRSRSAVARPDAGFDNKVPRRSPQAASR